MIYLLQKTTQNLRERFKKALGEMAVVVSSDNPYKNVLVGRNENKLEVVQTCQCSLWVAMEVVPRSADTAVVAAAADTIADTAVTDTGAAAAAAAAADTAVATAAAAAVAAAAAADTTAVADPSLSCVFLGRLLLPRFHAPPDHCLAARA